MGLEHDYISHTCNCFFFRSYGLLDWSTLILSVCHGNVERLRGDVFDCRTGGNICRLGLSVEGMSEGPLITCLDCRTGGNICRLRLCVEGRCEGPLITCLKTLLFIITDTSKDKGLNLEGVQGTG